MALEKLRFPTSMLLRTLPGKRLNDPCFKQIVGSIASVRDRQIGLQHFIGMGTEGHLMEKIKFFDITVDLQKVFINEARII